jgi:hypothetical protein
MRQAAHLVLTLGFVLLACSEKASRPPAGESGSFVGAGGGGGGATDGGAAADASVDAGDGGACNALAVNGVFVDRIGVVGDPPAPTGGTIADGKYDLTDYRVYVGSSGTPGPTGTSVQQTVQIAGGVVQSIMNVKVDLDAAPTQSHARTTSTFTVQGTSLFVTQTCPTQAASRQQSFSASNTQLLLIDPQSREQFTYTLR